MSVGKFGLNASCNKRDYDRLFTTLQELELGGATQAGFDQVAWGRGSGSKRRALLVRLPAGPQIRVYGSEIGQELT